MEEHFNGLKTAIWRTAGSRYNAARRLKRKELFSTISLTFFSVISICLAVIQKLYSDQISLFTGLDTYITALSIFTGIFLLAISLMEWGARNGSNADALHKNAEELNSLQRELGHAIEEAAFIQNGDWSNCTKLLKKYDEIKSRCELNHSSLDDSLFLAQHMKSIEFQSKKIKPCTALAVKSIWFLASIWYYLIFWVISVIALVPIMNRISLLG